MLELKEGYGYTPTLIAVCNEHGAAICGDSRMMALDGDKALFMDDCRKVFKVNDELLYGVSGMFHTDSMLIEPLVGKKAERLNVGNMATAIQNYLLEQKAIGDLRECSYILAGKDRGGRMCIASIRYSEDDDTIYADKQYCTGADILWISLPPAAALNENQWREKLTKAMEESGEKMLSQTLSDFIIELAKESKFVGGHIVCRIITSEKEETPGE